MNLVFRKPMLAAPLLSPEVEHTDERIMEALSKLRYPVLASLKMDGIRALRLGGSLLSRTLKLIPNKSIRGRSIAMPAGFDMELWTYDIDYNDIQSIVMSHEHPDSDAINFHVLDCYHPTNSYAQRIESIKNWMTNSGYHGHRNEIGATLSCGICLRYPQQINTPEKLLQLFNFYESEHGEGICFRTPNSPYKFGRSTLKEQYLVKLCRYVTDEAIIVGFEEQMENGNPARRNRTGLMDRSHSQGRLIPKGTLGSLIVENSAKQMFSIGTGFTDRLRKEIWDNRNKYGGKTITYRCKKHGQKILPRCPSFRGFRNAIDL